MQHVKTTSSILTAQRRSSKLLFVWNNNWILTKNSSHLLSQRLPKIRRQTSTTKTICTESKVSRIKNTIADGCSLKTLLISNRKNLKQKNCLKLHKLIIRAKKSFMLMPKSNSRTSCWWNARLRTRCWGLCRCMRYARRAHSYNCPRSLCNPRSSNLNIHSDFNLLI